MKPEDKSLANIAEAVKRVINKETEVQPSDKDFVDLHSIDKEKRRGSTPLTEKDIEEANEFTKAAAKAAVAGDDEFEFDGKKYPTEMDVEVAKKILGESADSEKAIEEGKFDKLKKKLALAKHSNIAFVEVNGTRLTNENRNQLGFRGKPGENVNAVIVRDGAEMPISFARGAVQVRYSKDQVMNNISSGDAEGWGPEEFNIIETGATNEGVVHVLHWSEFVEEATGYKANAYTMTRFMFDEDGKAAWVGNLSEDRFVLEQQGWSISR